MKGVVRPFQRGGSPNANPRYIWLSTEEMKLTYRTGDFSAAYRAARWKDIKERAVKDDRGVFVR